MRRAILSVSDKTGLISFGKALVDAGFRARVDRRHGQGAGRGRAACDQRQRVTGFPEMMDGRVKTLHPKIHGGILARRDHPEDLAARRRSTASAWWIWWWSISTRSSRRRRSPASSSTISIEQIDIGGPSLVRAAAKNFRDVLDRGVAEGLRRGDCGTRSRRRADAGISFRPGPARVRAHRRVRHRDRVDAGRRSTLKDGDFRRPRAPVREPEPP